MRKQTSHWMESDLGAGVTLSWVLVVSLWCVSGWVYCYGIHLVKWTFALLCSLFTYHSCLYRTFRVRSLNGCGDHGVCPQIRLITINRRVPHRSVEVGSSDSEEAKRGPRKLPSGQKDKCGKAKVFQAEARTATQVSRKPWSRVRCRVQIGIGYTAQPHGEMAWTQGSVENISWNGTRATAALALNQRDTRPLMGPVLAAWNMEGRSGPRD